MAPRRGDSSLTAALPLPATLPAPNRIEGQMTKRSYGTGSLYQEGGAWYGRFRANGRRFNRKLGKVREPGSREGLTKAQAEAALRKLIEAVTSAPAATGDRLTVEEVGERLLQRLAIKGRKPATIEAVESTLRVHLVPHFGSKPLDKIDTAAVERFIAWEADQGKAPKSIRNYLGVLHSLFDLAIEKGWASANPVNAAAKPEAERSDEIRFLTVEELEAVLLAIPADTLGGIEPTLYLTAAMTGLRQGELFGLRWQDVDWLAGRVRVRRAYVRGEFGTTKSKRGNRSVPLADRVAVALEELSRSSAYTADDDLVFGHPDSGHPLDRSKIRKRFQAACRRAGVRVVRFHDLRHTFGTRMAAQGVPMRTLQEWMGHRDHATTLIYADYAPQPDREREMVQAAFAPDAPPRSNSRSNLSETQSNSQPPNDAPMRGSA